MSTLTKSYPFPRDAQGWVFTPTTAARSAITGAWDTAGNPPGSLRTIQGGAASTPGSGNWAAATTWEGMGIPAGSTVTAVQISNADEYVSANAAGSVVVGPYVLLDGVGTTRATLLASRSVAGVDGAWQTRSGASQAVPVGMQASASSLTLQLTVGIGAAGSYGGTVAHDNLQFTITYTPGPGSAFTAAGVATANANGVRLGQALFGVTAESGASAAGASRSASAFSAAGVATAIGYRPPLAAFRPAASASASGVGASTARTSFIALAHSSAVGQGAPAPSVMIAAAGALADFRGASTSRAAFSAAGAAIPSVIGDGSGVPILPAGSARFTAHAGDWSAKEGVGGIGRGTAVGGGSAGQSSFSASGGSASSGGTAVATKGGRRTRGSPCGCDCGPGPPGAGKCQMSVGVAGCKVVNVTPAWWPYEGPPYPIPTSVPNDAIGATVRVTGPGVDVTTITGVPPSPSANTAVVNIPLDPTLITYTVSVTAPGYWPQTRTVQVRDCNWIGGLGQLAVYVNFQLVPTSYTINAFIGRCDYPNNVPSMDDGSGTVVTCSQGGGATTDSNGFCTFTVPTTGNNWNVALQQMTFSAAGPAPYYGTDNAPYASLGPCVGTILPNVPLLPPYICCVTRVAISYGPGCPRPISSFFPKSRPVPPTLHATVGGTGVLLTSMGGCSWQGCATIAGLCCTVTFDGAQVAVRFLSQDPNNNQGNGRIWKQGYCYHYIGSPFAPISVTRYFPTCRPAGCACAPGDTTWNPNDPFPGTFTLTVPVGDQFGGGATPINCTGTIDASCYPPGCPFAGAVTVTE